MQNLKVAVIHDWLYVYGGAEGVLEAILDQSGCIYLELGAVFSLLLLYSC